MPANDRPWTEIIEARAPLIQLRLGELWRYRDLVAMFVRRDFVANYKQTILGPVWFFLQPLLTSLTYVLVFSRAAGLGPRGLPPIVFYLSGITIWNFFAECMTKTATVFRDNASVFGKVYFPRLTMPVSIVVSGLVKFAIQFVLFAVVCAYYIAKDGPVHPTSMIVLLPVLVGLMGLLALGLGMTISALTTKYRDLIFLLTFGVQLLMFATPVIIPLERIPEQYHAILALNPITPFVEAFRYVCVGSGTVSAGDLSYGVGFAVVSVLVGAVIFNRVERTFTDTV